MVETMTSLWKACLLLIALTAIPVAAQPGSTFYVAKTGHDSNSGTYTAPWLTIQHSANSATAGATVYVEAGVYKESVNFPASGTAANPITFANYPGQKPVIDGTKLSVSGIQGLINIVNQSYVTITGFEIRNYTTANAGQTPTGIWVTGSGTGVQLLNNLVHNITTTSEKAGNAFGIAVYGTATTPITQITISGNQVYNLKTGNSESVNVDGNVTYFTVSNNVIHNNDNIGFAAIGGEGVGPAGYDRASYGEVSGNTIYSISGIKNPGEGNSYDADGLYCDGCEYVVFERNLVHNCDLNVEVAAEHGGLNGSYVTVRSNVLYAASTVGISIGGYGNCTVGDRGSDHVVIVNNSFYNNNTKNQGAEFQIQYRADNTNIFENNIVYAGTQNSWIYGFTKDSSPQLNWNLYYSKRGYVEGNSITYSDKSNFANFSAYQSGTGEDQNSFVANPDYISLTTPPNLDLASSSPAINSGSTNLTCSVGYCGSSSSIYGDTDFAGNPRMNASGQINLGAYEQ